MKVVLKSLSKNSGQLRICFVSHSAYMGGAERALLEAVLALKEKGVVCHVVLPYEGPLCEELIKRNITFRVIKYRSWVYLGRNPWVARIIDLLISLIMVIPLSISIIRWKSNIVYTNTITIFTGAIAAFLTKRSHVWHIHEFGVKDHGLKFMCGERFTMSVVNRLSDICIANSKAVANEFQRIIMPEKLKVVYQSVSVLKPMIHFGKADVFTCVIVGKVSEGKNQEDAVNAIGELIKRGVNVQLCIVGDGVNDYIARLNEIIKKNDLQNNIKFIGYTDDGFAYMCLADVVLMCSRSEAFGRVTVEGMLAGKPVIGAKGGATPELIQEGITGLLYTPGNHQELAEKIQYLWANPEKASLMGQRAREWASRNFEQKRYGEDLMRLLSKFSEDNVKCNLA